MADVLAVRNKYRMENWSALIQECNASGLSNREFCQQRGISEKKLLLLAEETSESSGRCGINGLAAIVTQQYAGPLSEESLFLFCGRRTDQIKALYWSGDGYILLYKRRFNGQFQWPRSESELRLIDHQSFRRLMKGLAGGHRNSRG